jgi:hypothetical protein
MALCTLGCERPCLRGKGACSSSDAGECSSLRSKRRRNRRGIVSLHVWIQSQVPALFCSNEDELHVVVARTQSNQNGRPCTLTDPAGHAPPGRTDRHIASSGERTSPDRWCTQTGSAISS